MTTKIHPAVKEQQEFEEGLAKFILDFQKDLPFDMFTPEFLKEKANGSQEDDQEEDD